MHDDARPARLPAPTFVLALALATGLVACSGPGATRYDTATPTPPAGSATPAATLVTPAATLVTPAASGATASPASLPPGTAPRPTPTAPPVVLVGAGDIASCGSSGDEATAALLDGIAGTVFTAGDNVYDRGTAAEFAGCYDPTWGRHRDRTLPVPGNHDYATDAAAGYFAYFGAAAGNPVQGWYATDLGAWRIYALNSDCWAIGGCDAGSAQERWLREDLAANPRACVLAIWHHPRFSSGDHGSDPMTAALWQDLDDAGAEIIVNGHDHDYERFGPQDVSGAADPDGIVEVVVGTGGRSHYAFGTPIANSLVRDSSSFGVIRFDLDAGGWSSTFVPVAGATFTDTAAGTCH